MPHPFDDEPAPPFPPPPRPQAPALNAPLPVLLTIAAFIVVHLLRTVLLSPQTDTELLLTFALVPELYARVLSGQMPVSTLPFGLWGLVIAPFSHFFLHANWMHLAMNALWMLVFGTPVARRVGGWRFITLALICAGFGGLAFLLLHWGEQGIMVGASGGISGLMGASVRLIYAENLPLTIAIRRDVRRVRPLSTLQALTLPGPRLFILVWIGINLVIGITGFGAGGGLDRIAGEAHIAGFFAGLLLFGLFDKKRER